MNQPIEEIADKMLIEATRHRASDIHLLPARNGGIIRFRLDGELILYQTLQKDTYHRLLSHFKFLASMDIGEKRKPQTGALVLPIHHELFQLRLSSLPSLHSESLVIRIHPPWKQISLSQLSLLPNIPQKLSSFLQYSHGLFVFSGSTGAGKSTTLYSLLQENIAQQQNIITLEDPIEQRHYHMIQVQINEKAGITFEAGLKAILRHDPDIILVGEIRDEQTAKIAMQAALTGHTVLATLHTKDALGALPRLLDLGISVVEMEQALRAVVHQKLVKVTCAFCPNVCSIYCNRRKRLALYEILTGSHIKRAIKEAKGVVVSHQFATLKSQFVKAYALGYIKKEELERGMK